MDLVGFLKKTREDVASLNYFEEVHVVIGNAACDLDSTVSAILHAFYLSKISDEGNRTIIPVLNIPREDYTLRTEVVSYLSSHRLEDTLLTFRNDLDLRTLALEKNLKLTLVDHNTLNQEDSELLDSLVVEVIDHHENTRKDDAEREISIVVEPVGSCVTLVVGNILEESEDLVDERIAMLATGTILLDTVNLSSDAGRTTPKDIEVIDKLRKFCPNVVHQDIFDSLQRAKFDISGLSAMDVLRKDFKSVSGNDVTIGLSTVPCSIEQLLEKLEGGDVFNEFCESRGLSALLLVAVYLTDDGSVQRELGIFSLDAVLRNKLETHLSSGLAGLLLEAQNFDCIGLSSFYQGNANASRKVILPLIQNFLAGQAEEKTDLKEDGEEDEGKDESGATEIKVVETTDLLGGFETLGSQTTNPFGPPPPILHGNTNNSNPFHVESTLPAQEYSHANDIFTAQSSQQVFNLLDFDPMGSPSPSNEIPQPTSSGLDLFSFDPFASTTSPSVALSEGSQAKDEGVNSLGDPSPEKGPTDSLFLLDLGDSAPSQSTQPVNSDLQVLKPFGTANSTQNLHLAFQPLDGTNQVRDGIAPSSFDEGVDIDKEDDQRKSSSPQIGEVANDELFSLPQGNNPFANVEVNVSLEDVKHDQTMEFSTETLETKNSTTGSLLFDFTTGDLSQEEEKKQLADDSNPTQPLKEDLVVIQPGSASQLHDGFISHSFDKGDIHTDGGKVRSSSQVGGGADELFSVSHGNNPFVNVEVNKDDHYNQTMEFSTDALETNSHTQGSLLFDFTTHVPTNALKEQEKQYAEENHPTQSLGGDLFVSQPENANQVHDGILSKSFDERSDVHTDDYQKESQLGEEVNTELHIVPPKGNPFTSAETDSFSENDQHNVGMEFSIEALETKNDTAGSALLEFVGDSSQVAVPEEKDEQSDEEVEATSIDVENINDIEESDHHKSDSLENVSVERSSEDRDSQEKVDLTLQESVDTATDTATDTDTCQLHDGSGDVVPLKTDNEETIVDTSIGMLHELETVNSGNLNVILEEREDADAASTGSVDFHAANGDTTHKEGKINSWNPFENEATSESDSTHTFSFQTKEPQREENVEGTFNVSNDVLHETEGYLTKPIKIPHVRNYSAPLTPNNSFGDVEDAVVTSTPQIDEAELSEKVEELHRSRSQSLVEMEMDVTSRVEIEGRELRMELSEKLQDYQEEERSVEKSLQYNENDNLAGIVLNFDPDDKDFEGKDEDNYEEDRHEISGGESGSGDVIIAENVNLSFQSAMIEEEEIGEMDGGDRKENAEVGDVLDENGGGIPYLDLQVPQEQTEKDAEEVENVPEDEDDRESLSTDVEKVENDLVVPHQFIKSKEEGVTVDSYEEELAGKDFKRLGSESEEDEQGIAKEEMKEKIEEGERNDKETFRQEHNDGVGLKLETEEIQQNDEMGEGDEGGTKEFTGGMDREDSDDDGEHSIEMSRPLEYIERKDEEMVSPSVGEDGDEEENASESHVEREEREDESKEHEDEDVTAEERNSEDASEELHLDSVGSKENYFDDQSDEPVDSQLVSRTEFMSEKILNVETTDLNFPASDSKILQELNQSENVLLVADKGDEVVAGGNESKNSGPQQFDVHLIEETPENALEDPQEEVNGVVIDSLEVQDVKSELLFSDFRSAEQDKTEKMEKEEFTERKEFEGKGGEMTSVFEMLPNMEQREDEKWTTESTQLSEAIGDVRFTSQDEERNKTNEQPFDWKQINSVEKLEDQEDDKNGLNLERDEGVEGEEVVDFSVESQQDISQLNSEFEETSKDLESEEERVEERAADSPVLEDVKQELLMSEFQPSDQAVTAEMEGDDREDISEEKIGEDFAVLEDIPSREGGKQEVIVPEISSADQEVTTEIKEVEWTHIAEEIEGGMGEAKTSLETVLESNGEAEKAFTDSVKFSEPAVNVTLTFDDKTSSELDEQPFESGFKSGEQLEDLVGFNSEKIDETEDDVAGDKSEGILEDANQGSYQKFEETVADLSSEGEEEGFSDKVQDIPLLQDGKEDLLASKIEPADQLVSTGVEKVEYKEDSEERTSEDEDSTESEGGEEVEGKVSYEVLSDAEEEDKIKEISVGIDRKTEDSQEYPDIELNLDLVIPSVKGEHSTIDHVVTEEVTHEIQVVADLHSSPPTPQVLHNEESEKEFGSSVQHHEPELADRLSSQDEMQRQIDEQPFDGESFESFEEMKEEDVDKFNSKRDADAGAEGDTAVDLLEGSQEDPGERVVEGLVDLAVVEGVKQESFPLEVQSTDQLVTMETKEVQWTLDTEKLGGEIGGFEEGVWGDVRNQPNVQEEEVKKGFEDSFVVNEPDVNVKVTTYEEVNSQVDKQTWDSTLSQSSEERKDHGYPLDGSEEWRTEEQENESVVGLSEGSQKNANLGNSELLMGSSVIGKQVKTKKEGNENPKSKEYEVQMAVSDGEVMNKYDSYQESVKEKKKDKKSGEKPNLVSVEENQGTPKDRNNRTSASTILFPGPSDMDSGTLVADPTPLVVPLIEVSVLRDIDLPEFGNASWEDSEDMPPTMESVSTPEVTQQFEIEEEENSQIWHEETSEKSVEVENPLLVETSNDQELEKFDAVEEEERSEREISEELDEKRKEEVEVSAVNNQTRADDDQPVEELHSHVDKKVSSVSAPQTFEEFSTSSQSISEEIYPGVQLVTNLNVSPPTMVGDHHEMDSSTYNINVSENGGEVDKEHSSLWEKDDKEVTMEEKDDKEVISSRDGEEGQDIADENHDKIQKYQDTHTVTPFVMDSQFTLEENRLEELSNVNEDQSIQEEQVLANTSEMGDVGNNEGDIFEEIMSRDPQTEMNSSHSDEVEKVEEREESLSDILDGDRLAEKEDATREVNDDEVNVSSSDWEFVENSMDKYDDEIIEDQNAGENMPSMIDSRFVVQDGDLEEISKKEVLSREVNDDEVKDSSSEWEFVENSSEKCGDVVQEDGDAGKSIPIKMDNQFVVFGSNLEDIGSVKEVQTADQDEGIINFDQIGNNHGTNLEGLDGDFQTETCSSGSVEMLREEEMEEREETVLDNFDESRHGEKGEDMFNLDEGKMDETLSVDIFENSEQITKEEKDLEETAGAVGVIEEEEEILLREVNIEESSLMVPEKTQNRESGLDQVSDVLDEQSEEAHTEELKESGVEGVRRTDEDEEYPSVESDAIFSSTTEQHITNDQLFAAEILTEVQLVGDVSASPPAIEIDHNELDFSESHHLDISEHTDKETELSGMAEQAIGSDGSGIVSSVKDDILATKGDVLFPSTSSDFEKTETSQSKDDNSSSMLVSVDVHQESGLVDWGDTEGSHGLPDVKSDVNTEISFGVSSTTGEEKPKEEKLVEEEVIADIQVIADLNASPPLAEVDHNELDFSDSYKLNIAQDPGRNDEHSATSVEVIGIDDELGVSSKVNILPEEGSNLETTAMSKSVETPTDEFGKDSASDVVGEISGSQTVEFKTGDRLIDESSLKLNQKDDFLVGKVAISDGDNRREGVIEKQTVPEEESSLHERPAKVSMDDGNNVKIDSGEEGRMSESLVSIATEEAQFGEIHNEKSDDILEAKDNEYKGDSGSMEEETEASPESSTTENLTNQKRAVIISSNFTDLEAKQFELSLKPPGSLVEEEVFSPTQSDFSESGVDMSPGHPVQTTRRERPNSLSLSDISVNSEKGAGVVLPHVDTPSILSPGMESMSSMYSHEGYFISPDMDEDDETPTPVSDLKPMEEGPLDHTLKRPLSVDSELTQNVSKGWADNQSLLEAIMVKQKEKLEETDEAGNLESEADVTPVDASPESITKEPESDLKDTSSGDVRDKERGEAEGAEEEDADSISITISRKEPPVTPPEVVSPVAEADSSRDRLDTMLSEGSLGEITLDDDDEDYEDEGFDPESKGAYSGAADSPSRKRLSVGLGLDSTSVTTEVLDAAYPAVLTPSSNEMSWDDDASVDKKNKRVEPIPEYTAKEEHDDRWRWRKVKVGDTEYTLDNKVIEPFKKVLSHGGYYGDSVNAIIVVASCYLPERSRKDYHYVMQNLFLYVVSSLELLVAQDYMIVYFHGAAPRDRIPSLGWMKRCYQMIDRRLRKNLKGLYIVHPTAWLKTVITFTRPFISAKFYRKLKFIYHLDELKSHLSMEYIYVPDEVKRLARE